MVSVSDDGKLLEICYCILEEYVGVILVEVLFIIGRIY